MRSYEKRLLAVALMAIMLGTLQSGGPALAAPTPAAHKIYYRQLKNGDTLPDGDVIHMSVSNDRGVPPYEVEIQLQLSGVSWWKGIQSGPIVLCQAQDNQKLSIARFSLSDLQKKGLQLWKAKFLGVHHQMYNVEDASKEMGGGKTYSFVWLRDK